MRKANGSASGRTSPAPAGETELPEARGARAWVMCATHTGHLFTADWRRLKDCPGSPGYLIKWLRCSCTSREIPSAVEGTK